ncbi:MAG: WD40/YVTN/BNR-like repeat-containing protein, partial [Chitinophagales bacterium]
MKQFILTIILGLFATEEILSQKTQDTIDHPYFLDMMQNRANNFLKTKRAFELYFSNKPLVKGTGWKQFERWAENAQHQTNPDGSFIDPDYILKEYRRVKSRQLTTRSSSGNWVNLGPFNDILPLSSRRQVGRINTIGFHPTNPNFLFAGAPQGGFWVSQNKGVNWTSTTDNMPTLGVSDIAVLANAGNPIILIGTGDRDANDANGLGIYRSIDSGKTFTVSNTGMGNTTVNMMAVNPQNERTILAATDNGIYRSVNAGLNWTKVSVATGEFMDIKYCPGDSMT